MLTFESKDNYFLIENLKLKKILKIFRQYVEQSFGILTKTLLIINC